MRPEKKSSAFKPSFTKLRQSAYYKSWKLTSSFNNLFGLFVIFYFIFISSSLNGITSSFADTFRIKPFLFIIRCGGANFFRFTARLIKERISTLYYCLYHLYQGSGSQYFLPRSSSSILREYIIDRPFMDDSSCTKNPENTQCWEKWYALVQTHQALRRRSLNAGSATSLILFLPTSWAQAASVPISASLPASALAIFQKLSLYTYAYSPHGLPSSPLYSPLSYAPAARHLSPYPHPR